METGVCTSCSYQSVTLDLVKTQPFNSLVTSAPVNPGALEVPPEVPMGDFPLENQGATLDGTCKCWSPLTTSSVVKSFREAEGYKVLRDNFSTPGGGG